MLKAPTETELETNDHQEGLGVSIIIPAYNEEDGIGPVLEHLTRVTKDIDLEYEVVVVDDGSQDETAEVAKQYPGITVLQHKGNRGYGAALKTGIRHAQFGLVCITDADGTYPNERIPDLIDRMLENSCDMIVGARVGDQVAIPLVRRPAKWAVGQLANLVSGEPIPDINSGLRIFKRSTALRFFDMLPDGFSFTTTITLGMLANGYLVEYVPINYSSRVGQSKIRPVRDTLNFVELIFRIALYFAPLKIFLPLSGLLFTLAVAWGVYSRYVAGQLADVSTMIIAMAAFQTAMMGLLAELMNQRLPNHYQE